MNGLFDLDANLAQIEDAQWSQDFAGHTWTLASPYCFFDQSQEHMLCADGMMIEPPRLIFRHLHNHASAVRKALIHREHSLGAVVSRTFQVRRRYGPQGILPPWVTRPWRRAACATSAIIRMTPNTLGTL